MAGSNARVVVKNRNHSNYETKEHVPMTTMSDSLATSLQELLSKEIAHSILPAVKGSVDNLYELTKSLVEKQVNYSVGYWFDKRWWASSHQAGVSKIVEQEAAKILRERLTPEYLDEMAATVMGRVGDSLTEGVEERVISEILRRAFPQHIDGRNKMRRILRGAAITLLVREKKAQEQGISG